MMVINQNVHRQPIFPVTKPPIIGPMIYVTVSLLSSVASLDTLLLLTGPRIGPIPNRAIACPRFPGGIRSATVPPPIVKDADAAHPQINRNTRNMAILVLKAQPTVNPT